MFNHPLTTKTKEMKTNNLIIACVAIVVLSVLAYISLPEGKIIQYRVEDSYSRYGSNGQRIRIVIDNEMDEYIEVPNLSTKEIFIMCDSLNSKINQQTK